MSETSAQLREEPSNLRSKIMSEWIAALRSGEYAQGEGVLRSGNLYCCLGVLCEVAIKNGIIPLGQKAESDGIYEYDGNHATLPATVRVVLGIDQQGSSSIYDPLTYLNDTTRLSFSKIADVIEDIERSSSWLEL